MPKLHRPEPGQPTLITVGERVLEIKFPLGILKTLDHEHGISILKGAAFGEVIQSPGKLAILLYYGLKTKHPEITEQWVDDNIEASMLLEIAPYILYAMSGRWSRQLAASLEDEEDVIANPPQPVPEPEPEPEPEEQILIGSRSGQSRAMTSDSANPKSGA
jgi:hypothetical protein